MIRRLAVAALAVAVGAALGATGIGWWLDRPTEPAAQDARLVATAGDDWYGQILLDSCSVVPVDIYNAGDQPIDLSGLRAGLTTRSSLTCRPEVGHVTIQPRTSRTIRAAIGFRCADGMAEPTFAAVVGPASTPVSGHVSMPPLDPGWMCSDGGPTWFRARPSQDPTGTGPDARLPVTLMFSSGKQGTKLTSIDLRDSKAFALEPPRLPVDISALAPGAAPPDVYVELFLTVRDCARARAFRSSDLIVTSGFTPGGEFDQPLAEGDRVLVRQLVRLVDAAC
ncbi:hypothetical protein [Tenggerimyces flavus]|uniref:Uncharacterized protein n=1 Tax=Tenggerimyces flavus TaxID=1708749 RepID=A0ABV7Y9P4_9ACTN|nr:hypothetical protein [Tenggerimyces flavus]MBM7783455.1 hypothetical protein [Tenggerimyces flavus]